MTKEIHRFLDDYGTQEMFNILLEVSDSNFKERTVTEVNSSSDENHIPTAAAVYKTLKDILNGYDTPKESLDALKSYFDSIKLKTDKYSDKDHLETEMITGQINTVASPNTHTLYLQRDNVFDKTWKMYIYSETEYDGTHWICIGNTEPDLVGYWRKDQIDELKEFLGVSEEVEYIPLTSEYINGRVNVIFNKHKPE